MLYGDFATQEELDAQYNLTMMFPEAAASYEAFCERESKRARSELDHRLDGLFGPTRAEHVDIYPARENAPKMLDLGQVGGSSSRASTTTKPSTASWTSEVRSAPRCWGGRKIGTRWR
jgi:hypothetical protein